MTIWKRSRPLHSDAGRVGYTAWRQSLDTQCLTTKWPCQVTFAPRDVCICMKPCDRFLVYLTTLFQLQNWHSSLTNIAMSKVKWRFHPIIGREDLLWRIQVELYCFLWTSAHWMGVGGQHHSPAAFTPGKEPVLIVQAGWASEPVWIGAENLALTGIWSPDLPASSESLYRLHHSGS